MTMIAANLQRVHERIAAVCAQAQRPASAVRLLAVSKTFGAADVQAAHAAGQRMFGENYVQEGVEKITLCRDLALQWHLIGPLQANKTRTVAAAFDWVESIDRLRIAQRLSEQRPETLPPLQVCLQVNADGGPNKSGVAPDELLALAREVAALPRLRLRGLMSIPEPGAAPEVYRRLRQLFDDTGARLREEGRIEGDRWDTLSLGMTADLEAAIAAGSTQVRVGTAIFGGRPAAAATSSPAPHPSRSA